MEQTGPARPTASIRPTIFPGRYRDARGDHPVTWQLVRVARSAPGGPPGYELRIRLRGVVFAGPEPDGLAPTSPAEAVAHGFAGGDLGDCVLAGELPCAFEVAGTPLAGAVSFRLDLRAGRPAGARVRNLRLRTAVSGSVAEAVEADFERALPALEAALPDRIRLRSCTTCRYSGYSPAESPTMGTECHRDAKDQYLAVRTREDYWAVPVTEVVPETHLCEDYLRRTPGP